MGTTLVITSKTAYGPGVSLETDVEERKVPAYELSIPAAARLDGQTVHSLIGKVTTRSCHDGHEQVAIGTKRVFAKASQVDERVTEGAEVVIVGVATSGLGFRLLLLPRSRDPIPWGPLKGVGT